jgi:hypothetical protein
MRERSITKDQVESALRAPDRREQDLEERSVRFEKDFDGRVLKVWVAAEPWPPSDTVVIKSTAWKYVDTFEIPADTIGRVIGRNGTTIQQVRNTTGAQIAVRDVLVQISAGDRRSVERARQMIDEITRKPVRRT